MSTVQVSTLDMTKLEAFIGQFVTDLGATVHTGIFGIGEKLGLYKALADRPMTSAQLSAKTKTAILREQLSSQGAGGYISYDEKTGMFRLNAVQTFTMATEDSPAYLPGAFELALGSPAAVPRITESFRTGAGMGWHQHVDEVFHGCEKSFLPSYAANLVGSWIPALSEVKEKLEAGAHVADVGCGKGASTLVAGEGVPPISNGTAASAVSPSKCRRKRTFQARLTTSSPSSIACTIWAITAAAAGLTPNAAGSSGLERREMV